MIKLTDTSFATVQTFIEREGKTGRLDYRLLLRLVGEHKFYKYLAHLGNVNADAILLVMLLVNTHAWAKANPDLTEKDAYEFFEGGIIEEIKGVLKDWYSRGNPGSDWLSQLHSDSAQQIVYMLLPPTSNGWRIFFCGQTVRR